MDTTNFKEKINLYLQSNPKLTYDQFGILLLIDNLYKEVPDDVSEFRRLFAHLDPNIIDKTDYSVMFLEIVHSKEPISVIKHRLNSYINVKYNYLGDSLSYEENMKKFRQHSIIVSEILRDILRTANLPAEIVDMLKEEETVAECTDFYALLVLYKSAKTDRTRFEILRKIGLIVLLSRIDNYYIADEIDLAIKKVKKVFDTGLGLMPNNKKFYYLWVDEDNKVVYTENKRKAAILYQDAVLRRNERALPKFSMQVFEYIPARTQFNSDILHFCIRNKLKKDGQLSYTSIVEKIVRKNIEFPSQVHDMIGVKLVVKSDNEIPQLIQDIQTFLGGSSTRKKEKNTLDKFGKKTLSKFSSKDYFVWKAIYDITLPHPMADKVKKILQIAKGCKKSCERIEEELSKLRSLKRDVVVEVQLQDINSYLLSIAKGSPTDHSLLKTNQVRNSSFYKLFPKEIYEEFLLKLRRKILQHKSKTD